MKLKTLIIFIISFEFSVLISATADDYPVGLKPAPPVNVTVQQLPGGRLNISWVPPRRRGAAKVARYTIEYKTVAKWVKLHNLPATTTHYLWTTASHGAMYYFRVISENSAAVRSESSNIATIFTSSCPDPVLYANQTLNRSGDTVVIECTKSLERRHLVCDKGKWIGVQEPCASRRRFSGSRHYSSSYSTRYRNKGRGVWRTPDTVPCSAPAKTEDEILIRIEADHATVMCLTNGAEWHLTCDNGTWAGERGVCPPPNCPELTYDENVYEIIKADSNSVVMVACKELNPDGRQKAWIMGCRDDQWFGFVGECDGKPH